MFAEAFATEGPRRSARLEALVRLLEDPSPVVREAVTAEFAAYGPTLREELRDLAVRPDAAGWGLLGRITGPLYRRRLRAAWPHWMGIADDHARLERALMLLAEFQNGPRWRPPLCDRLDGLAGEFRDWPGDKTPESLARFLFQEKDLRGARTGPLHPDSSNLACVLETGVGLPVSLACIYILVGARTGLDIRACNWPRHFLAAYRNEAGMFIVDPANGGAVVDAETFLSMQGTSREAAETVLAADVDAAAIVTRVMGNLVRAYRNEDDEDNCLLMLDLLREMESRLRDGALC